MPDWVITLLSLAGSTIVSTIIGVIVKKAVDKSFKRNDEYNRLKEEENARNRAKEVEEIIMRCVKPLSDKVDAIDKKLDLVEDGTKSALRNDILTCYYRCEEKSYRNDYDFENVHHMFESYKSLGGNSFIADVVERFDKLPTKEEYRKNKKKKLNESK